MPLDPKRVEAVYLLAVECREPADRDAVLDRECSADPELRKRVEADLKSHDAFIDALNRPAASAGSQVGEPPGDASLDQAQLTGCIFPDELGFAQELSSSRGNHAGSEVDRTVFARLPPEQPAARERPVPAISGYDILGELGHGGMGVVYKARQIRLNRPCVLKMILGGVHAGAEAVARFLAEAEAVARLQHPNIVQIHHIGEVDGLPFFELEYVPGGSLDRRLNGAPWPARRAAELVEALARGVAERIARGSCTAT